MVVPQIIDLQIIESQNIDAKIIEFDYIELPKIFEYPKLSTNLNDQKTGPNHRIP
jgi:hypothetical protein